LTESFCRRLQLVCHVEGDAGRDLVNHALDGEEGVFVDCVEVLCGVFAEPGDAAYDDTLAEDPANTVVVDDAGDWNVVVDVLFAGPPVCCSGVLQGPVEDTNGVMVPFHWKGKVPLLEVVVNHSCHLEDLHHFGLFTRTVGLVEQVVSPRSNVRKIDADESEPVSGVLLADIVGYPSVYPRK